MPILTFLLSPIGRWIGGTALVLALLGGAYVYLRTHYYSEGYNAALAAVHRKNQEAVNAADKASALVNACADRGGVWDQSRGVCE